MEEQFQRMSAKALRQAFMTSRAARTTVCMSSRLLRHSCTCADTRPSSCLQCCVWFSAKAAGVLDSALHAANRREDRAVGSLHLPCWPPAFPPLGSLSQEMRRQDATWQGDSPFPTSMRP